MKRRDVFKLVPLTLAGIGGLATRAGAMEKFTKKVGGWEDLPLPLMYPQLIQDMIGWVRKNQAENILEAGYAISRAVRKGNTCWINWDQGHSTQGEMFAGRHGMPEFLTHGYNPKTSKDGDLLMASRIISEAGFADAAQKDIYVIGAPSPWSGDARGFQHVSPDIQSLKIRSISDLWIETNITSYGAVLELPGMPAPMGPVSGPVYMAIMWMAMADACRALAIEGKPMPIMGDEPDLGGRTNYIDLDEPLMIRYLDDTMRELGLIGSELGSIRKIASMAADTLLDGGTVYHYSRYSMTYRGEANGRRGGLALARGLSDGDIQGTSKDCVIMGVFQPDDPVDLKNLDEFKKRGMRIASIGPITRNFAIPEGRCVHKEVEAHAGRMSDTYGLYAIPGFKKKVCPTSGLTMIAVHWAMSLALVEEIKERTGGDVPGVHFSGALKWGSEFNARVRAMQQDRGY